MPDGVDTAGCLFGQRFTPTVGPAGQTALVRKRLKVHFLDMNLGADIRPAPFTGQIQARQDPRLDLFPGVYSQEYAIVFEFVFDLVESGTPPFPAITINAKNKRAVIG